MDPITTVYRAAAVRDADRTAHRPGAVATRDGQIIAVGPANRVLAEVNTPARVIDLPRALILPALVNAHAHLNLTDLGPTPGKTPGSAPGSAPYDGDFAHWLRMVIDRAPTDDTQLTHAIRHGLALSRQAGVAYLADIAPNPAAIRARWACDGPDGVSYLECFGRPDDPQQAASALSRQLTLARPHSPDDTATRPHHTTPPPRLELGLQPHAPYSAGLNLYLAATDLAQQHGYRLCTHLSETPEEIRFVRDGDGPLADLLHSLGKWDPSIRPTGQHPVHWLRPALEHAPEHTPWLLVHCNHLDDEHIQVLARSRCSVVYCPVASDYFRQHPPPEVSPSPEILPDQVLISAPPARTVTAS